MNKAQQQWLEQLGLTAWVPKKHLPIHRPQQPQAANEAQHATPEKIQALLAGIEEEAPAPPLEAPKATISTVTAKLPATLGDYSAMDWPTLQRAVQECQQCSLYSTRTQTVFADGDQQAEWMVIGEAPGQEEDRQGLPFVGRAGGLLNNMLKALGLPRQAVYIANVLKCRPPGNRDPKPEESTACMGYLERQIALVQPKVLLVLGRIAAQQLLQTTEPLGRLRGKLYHYGPNQIPMVISYHPAYLLRQPRDKVKAWEDLKLARQQLQ